MLKLTGILLVAFSTFFSCSASAQNPCPITFKLDVSHSALLVNILEDRFISEDEMELFLNHPETVTILDKIRSLGAEVKREDLQAELIKLSKGQEVNDKRFALKDYLANYENTRSIINYLAQNRAKVLQRMCNNISPYLPKGYASELNVILVSAVNTTGFYSGGDSFYMVAERFRGDANGLIDVVTHEAYHAVRSDISSSYHAAFEDQNFSAKNEEHVFRFLYNMLSEGTSTHIADPIEAGNEGAMRAFQYELAQRYRRQLPIYFNLFDAALYRLHHDSTAVYSDIHQLGLQGNESLYHVGAFMVKTIAEEDGPQSIPEYFKKHPAHFYLRYHEVALQNEDERFMLDESSLSILRKAIRTK